MSLKKRAIEGIVVAGSLVMMSTIAQAADLDGVQVRNAAVQAETDFATGGTAGVVARLDQLEAEAFGDIEAATAGVNQTGRLLVATAEEAVSDTEAAETLDAQLQQAEATEAQQADAEQSETEAAQSQADGEQTADAEQTDAGEQSEDAQSTDADQMSAEEQEWQNRLMADVDDFLYIRESGDECSDCRQIIQGRCGGDRRDRRYLDTCGIRKRRRICEKFLLRDGIGSIYLCERYI